MRPTLTVLECSPDNGQDMARDTPVFWALEEAGQPYDVRLVSFKAMKKAAHLALHPFGQIPACGEGGLVLFESGSVVHCDRYRVRTFLVADRNRTAAGRGQPSRLTCSSQFDPVSQAGYSQLMQAQHVATASVNQYCVNLRLPKSVISI